MGTDHPTGNLCACVCGPLRFCSDSPTPPPEFSLAPFAASTLLFRLFPTSHAEAKCCSIPLVRRQRGGRVPFAFLVLLVSGMGALTVCCGGLVRGQFGAPVPFLTGPLHSFYQLDKHYKPPALPLGVTLTEREQRDQMWAAILAPIHEKKETKVATVPPPAVPSLDFVALFEVRSLCVPPLRRRLFVPCALCLCAVCSRLHV